MITIQLTYYKVSLFPVIMIITQAQRCRHQINFAYFTFSNNFHSAQLIVHR